VLSTFTNYTLITKDLTASLARKAAAPEVARETAYFQANIGSVTSIDAFLGDRRLYSYAMKAFGLEDMTYAKAFMRKVLTEGTDTRASFANRLADDRYVAFARAFDFAQGASATGRAGTITEAGPTAAGTAQLNGALDLSGTFDFSGTNAVSFQLSTRVDAATTKSATIVLSNKTLASVVQNLSQVTAEEIAAAINGQIAASGDGNLAGKVQAGIGVRRNLFFETTAYANLGADGVAGGTGLAADTLYEAGGTNRTLAIRNVAPSGAGQTPLDIGFGTDLPMDAKAKSVTEAYLRQTLESDAGAEDTGVRLALYFARMAGGATSGYAILGDSALSQVVKTVLGLPAGGTSSEALARQAELIESKVDLASFRDPQKLDQFIKRFTAIWDAQNNTASDPILALFGNA
jgi:hypothetical protein